MTENQALNPTAGIIIIGNEILSGRTQDLNLSYIADKLGSHGVKIAEATIITDEEAVIIKTVLEYSKAYDFVFTTGGIGPTHDDITAASIAKAFSLDLEVNNTALTMMENQWGKVKQDDNRTIMAMMPVGAKLIDNPISGSPGFNIENVYVMAGIPEVMRAMLDCILPSIKHGSPFNSQTVKCYLSESVLAKGLKEIQKSHLEVEIGSYPFWTKGSFGASIVIRGTNNLEILKTVKQVCNLIKTLGAEPIIEVA